VSYHGFRGAAATAAQQPPSEILKLAPQFVLVNSPRLGPCWDGINPPGCCRPYAGLQGQGVLVVVDVPQRKHGVPPPHLLRYSKISLRAAHLVLRTHIPVEKVIYVAVLEAKLKVTSEEAVRKQLVDGELFCSREVVLDVMASVA
jgi:hypothetical protein